MERRITVYFEGNLSYPKHRLMTPGASVRPKRMAAMIVSSDRVPCPSRTAKWAWDRSSGEQ